jgi:hypothetical protein
MLPNEASVAKSMRDWPPFFWGGLFFAPLTPLRLGFAGRHSASCKSCQPCLCGESGRQQVHSRVMNSK